VFDALNRSDALDLGVRAPTRLLVQVFVPGRPVNCTLCAWQGRLLGAEKLAVHPRPTGPATVQHVFRAPQVRSIAERLVAGFGMSGFCAVECMVHAETGEAHVLEINRRVTPDMRQGRLIGIDLCAVHDALAGRAQSTRSDLESGEEHVLVHFPQEWIRDPESRWLREHPVDVPWDDP
jgi:hypothetical protein